MARMTKSANVGSYNTVIDLKGRIIHVIDCIVRVSNVYAQNEGHIHHSRTSSTMRLCLFETKSWLDRNGIAEESWPASKIGCERLNRNHDVRRKHKGQGIFISFYMLLLLYFVLIGHFYPERLGI